MTCEEVCREEKCFFLIFMEEDKIYIYIFFVLFSFYFIFFIFIFLFLFWRKTLLLLSKHVKNMYFLYFFLKKKKFFLTFLAKLERLKEPKDPHQQDLKSLPARNSLLLFNSFHFYHFSLCLINFFCWKEKTFYLKEFNFY